MLSDIGIIEKFSKVMLILKLCIVLFLEEINLKEIILCNLFNIYFFKKNENANLICWSEFFL